MLVNSVKMLVNVCNACCIRQALSLDGNQLAFIYTKAFNGISGLLSLDLQNNNISFLESRLFSNLNQLTTLFLQNNQLRNIELATFDGLASLSYVDLSSNRLRSERAPRLCRSANLRHIYLDDNQLDKIDSCMLASQRATRTLSLLGNPINCNCSLTWLLRLRYVAQLNSPVSYVHSYNPQTLQ